MKTSVFISFESGERIRKARKKQQMTQEELAFSLDISPSLISKIERGAYQVAKENFMAICDVLGLKADDLLEENSKEADNHVDIRLLLKTIEHDINMVGVNEAWEELQQIKLAPDDPLLGEYYYLQGRLYETSRNWGKAQEFYEKAIGYVEQSSFTVDNNIRAICYHGLSRVYGRKNKLDQALRAVQSGEEYFVDVVDRKHARYNLLLSKSIYLEKLNQNDNAFRISKELWENRTSLASSEAKTNLAQLQATLHNKFGLYDQAIYYAEEGLLLARLDKLYDRSIELWTTKGESYRKKGEFANAKHCLKSALKLKEKIHYRSLAVSTYTQLGLLYLDLNEQQQAKDILKKAVVLGEETKDIPRLMSALIALGDCYLQQGKSPEAQHQYESALVLSKTPSYEFHQWDILMKLAETCRQDNTDLYRNYIEQFHQLSLKLWKGGATKMESKTSKLHLDAEPPID